MPYQEYNDKIMISGQEVSLASRQYIKCIVQVTIDSCYITSLSYRTPGDNRACHLNLSEMVPLGKSF